MTTSLPHRADPRPGARWYGAAEAGRAPRRRTSGSPRRAAELTLQRGVRPRPPSTRSRPARASARPRSTGAGPRRRTWRSRHGDAVRRRRCPSPIRARSAATWSASYRVGAGVREHPARRGLPATSSWSRCATTGIAALYRASTERREALTASRSSAPSPAGRCGRDLDCDIAVQWLGGLLAARAITHRPMPSRRGRWTLVEFTLRGRELPRTGEPSSGSRRRAARRRRPRGRTERGRRRPRRGRPA